MDGHNGEADLDRALEPNPDILPAFLSSVPLQVVGGRGSMSHALLKGLHEARRVERTAVDQGGMIIFVVVVVAARYHHCLVHGASAPPLFLRVWLSSLPSLCKKITCLCHVLSSLSSRLSYSSACIT
jgi:hypothetical protein